jgi:predicted metal-dependent hydrolase
MDAGVKPEIRNLEFRTDDTIPRYWHGGRRSVTLFMNNLSVFFPAGERFFIASVKAHKQYIKDPELAAEARAFYAQEAIHSREHVRYNDMLRAQGYPVDAMESRVERLLGWVTKLTPLRMQLGVTCALEHFTALMADLLLTDDSRLEGAEPTMARLWRWHAAEENEHKAVAFDVFKAAGGNYLERVLTMLGTTLIFWAKVAEQQVRMMHHDRILWSLREWYALLKFIVWKPGGLFPLLPTYFSYFRPSFHPWDHDNRELLYKWRLEIEHAPEYGRPAPVPEPSHAQRLAPS